MASNLTDPSCTVTGLNPGTSYRYAVKAFSMTQLASGYAGPIGVTTESFATFTGLPSGTAFPLTAQHAFTTTLTASGNPTNFTFSIVNPPVGMTVDPTTGVVSWIPAESNVGSTSVTFQVSNDAGTGGTVTYLFNVAPDLPQPTYTSPNLINGTLYAVPKQALILQLTDSFSSDPVTWSLVSGPAGMQVDATTGAVIWTPGSGTQLGTVTALFQSTNAAGSINLNVPISVVFATAPGKLTVIPVTSSGGLDRTTLSWTVPSIVLAQIKHYQILVTQPGGSTGRFTTIYSVPRSVKKFNLTGLSPSALITVQICAVDAAGQLGIPEIISFVTP